MGQSIMCVYCVKPLLSPEHAREHVKEKCPSSPYAALRAERDALRAEVARMWGWIARLIVDHDHCPSCGGTAVYRANGAHGEKLGRAGFMHVNIVPGCPVFDGMAAAAQAATADNPPAAREEPAK